MALAIAEVAPSIAQQPLTRKAPERAAPESVETSLSYLIPAPGKPVLDVTDPGHREDIAGKFEWAPVEIVNGRWRRDTFSLDNEGFAFIGHRTALDRFDDDAEIERVYYAEMEELLKRETGASDVLIFDHTVRREGGTKQPVRRVHNDYTAASGPKRLAELVDGETAENLANRTFAQINVWRPLRGPVESAPLALADAQSVAPQDLAAADLVYADRTGEIYYAHWNPLHRWFYFPQMRSDEALLIKGYDAREDGRARFTLHTAFDDPATPENAAPRESIEIRALVFFD